MRVAVGHATARQQAADLNQFVDNRSVGFAFLALVIEHAQVGEERDVGQEFGFLTHIVGHPVHPVAGDEGVVIFLTVAWRSVDKARARVVGDVIAVNHGDFIVPEAVCFGGTIERVL